MSNLETNQPQKKFTYPNLIVTIELSVLIGLAVYEIIFQGGILGLRTLIVGSLIILSSLILILLNHKKVNPLSLHLAGSAFVLFGLISLRASPLLISLNFLTGIFLLMIFGASLAGLDIKKFNFRDYLFTWFSPILALPGLGFVTRALKRDQPKKPSKKSTKPAVRWDIIRGLLISAPIILIFLVLFSAADNDFAKLFSIDINWDLSALEPIFEYTFWVGALSLFFLGIFSHYLFGAKQPQPQKSVFKLGKTESIILMSSLVAVFVAFCLTQLDNVFGSLDLSNEEVANSARQGFGELMFASVLLFSTIFALQKQKANQSDKSFKSLSVILLILDYIVLASAFRRLLNYEEAFGFTLSRYFAHSLMIMIGIWLTIMIIKIWFEFKDSYLAGTIMATGVAFVLALNILNPDASIARSNLSRYDNETPIDFYYLDGLSSDAAPVFDGYLKSEVLSKRDKFELKRITCNREWRDNSSWLDWNRSDQVAKSIADSC